MEKPRSCIRERHNTLPVTALIDQSENTILAYSIAHNKGLPRFLPRIPPLTPLEQLYSTCLQIKRNVRELARIPILVLPD